MSSKYQMWLTHNGESEKIRFPVLPETINVRKGSANKSVSIQGLGEVVIMQEAPADGISFSSFFPAYPFPGVQFDNLTAPEVLANKIVSWKNSDKPSHVLLTGTDLNMFCVIESFTYEERGGDVGTLHYSIAFKEYKEVKARQVNVNPETKKVQAPAPAPARPDNRVPEKTVVVKKGDCLWNIAKKHLGSGSRYTEIVKLNAGLIKNPNLIQVGWTLKLPV